MEGVMIYRMSISDLINVQHIDDLNGRIAVHFIECLVCNSYRRMSYSLGIAQVSMLEHMLYEHKIQMDNTEDKLKNINYKVMAVDKDIYMSLYDLILIDP
jgi:hypothetical protein